MQLVRRGTPILYFAPPLSTDMRYGSAVYSGPEVMLLGVAGRQMAEFYRIPFFQSGFDTDAQCVDVQSAWDKALPVLAGLGEVGTIFKNAGSIGNGLIASHVHMVLDDEFFGICLRLIEGIEVSPAALATETIEAVASGGNYLAQPHTLEYLKKEHRIPQILNRLTYDRWRKAGGKNVMEVAREKAQAILDTHCPKPLDRQAQETLRGVILDFEKAHCVRSRN
jgi:trimethylamine--corrinoid protein Co-methyltransferase